MTSLEELLNEKPENEVSRINDAVDNFVSALSSVDQIMREEFPSDVSVIDKIDLPSLALGYALSTMHSMHDLARPARACLDRAIEQYPEAYAWQIKLKPLAQNVIFGYCTDRRDFMKTVRSKLRAAHEEVKQQRKQDTAANPETPVAPEPDRDAAAADSQGATPKAA
jgi:hypothetical protein